MHVCVGFLRKQLSGDGTLALKPRCPGLAISVLAFEARPVNGDYGYQGPDPGPMRSLLARDRQTGRGRWQVLPLTKSSSYSRPLDYRCQRQVWSRQFGKSNVACQSFAVGRGRPAKHEEKSDAAAKAEKSCMGQ